MSLFCQGYLTGTSLGFPEVCEEVAAVLSISCSSPFNHQLIAQSLWGSVGSQHIFSAFPYHWKSSKGVMDRGGELSHFLHIWTIWNKLSCGIHMLMILIQIKPLNFSSISTTLLLETQGRMTCWYVVQLFPTLIVLP